MWRYFSKINIDALVEITKRRCAISGSENSISGNGGSGSSSKDEAPTHTFADIRKRWGNHRKSIKNRMKKFYAKDSSATSVTSKDNRCCSSLSDDDLGSQAASCSTASSESTRSAMEHFPGEKESFVLKEIDKKYRKGEKHIFGSLGRLRKSRTSLCLEEISPRKKLAAASSATSTTSSSSCTTTDDGKGSTKKPDFQNELRKEMKRRCASDLKVKNCLFLLFFYEFNLILLFQKQPDQCHSKFYD